MSTPQKKKKKSSMASGDVQLESATGAILDPKYKKMTQAGRGYKPVEAGRLRLFLVGAVGEGKSSFAASVPRAAILDFENKYRDIPEQFYGEGTIPFYDGDPQFYIDLLTELEDDGRKGKRSFDTIIVDPCNIFVTLCRDFLTSYYRDKLHRGIDQYEDITNYGSDGNGWDKVNRLVAASFDQIYNAGYGWIALAHQVPKWKKVGARDIKTFQHALNNGVHSALYSRCDFAGTLTMESEIAQVGTGKFSTRKGKKVEKTKPVERKFVTLLINNDKEAESEDRKLPHRMPVPMPTEPFEVPEGAGFATFVKWYRKGVELKRNKEVQSVN